jgi:hypothetical protein
VFADALVPRALPLGVLIPKKNLETFNLARLRLHAGMCCSDGYRFAKRQGKPNSANLAAARKNKRFCDLARCAARTPFRFDSSRTLNCSSNLIGHDDPDKPANGGGE